MSHEEAEPNEDVLEFQGKKMIRIRAGVVVTKPWKRREANYEYVCGKHNPNFVAHSYFRADLHDLRHWITERLSARPAQEGA